MPPPGRRVIHLPQLPVVTPMLATAGAMPADPEKFAFEVKWDGMRLLVFAEAAAQGADRPGVKLRSRNGGDATDRYPDLAEPLTRLLSGRSAVLDGEVVAFGPDGRPSFARLQERMSIRRADQARSAATRIPLVLILFDLLHLDGEDLMDLPYRERRARLEHLAAALELPAHPRFSVPPVWTGTGAQGAEALRWTAEQGLEGVIAKRLDSPYLPGVRSRDWIKIKHRRTREVLLGGWLTARGSTALKSVLVGEAVGGAAGGAGLRYLGAVGSGFSQAERSALAAALRRAETPAPPFTEPPTDLDPGDTPHWIRPELVCEVEFSGTTPAGRLREPVWKGLRGVHQDEPPPY